jgi:hypothetical protein
MKCAYVAQNQVDAQLVAEELRAAGIDAVVKMDTWAAPSMPFPSVWVADADLPRAEALLAAPRDDADDAE